MSVLLSNIFLFLLLNGRCGVAGLYYAFGLAAAVFVAVGALMTVFYEKI